MSTIVEQLFAARASLVRPQLLHALQHAHTALFDRCAQSGKGALGLGVPAQLGAALLPTIAQFFTSTQCLVRSLEDCALWQSGYSENKRVIGANNETS